MNELIVTDIETTGLSGVNDHIVEIAWASVMLTESGAYCEPIRSTLVKPPISIPPNLSAIHHITDSDVMDHPTISEIALNLLPQFEGKIMVAHNAKFEKGFMVPRLTGDARWICTWKCGVKAWPEAPSHANVALGYYLGILKGRNGDYHAAHTAAYDVGVTAQILVRLLNRYSVDELLAISGEELVISTIPFGKYKGAQFKDVPKHYLQWLTTEATGIREDVLHAAKLEIDRRRREGL